MPPIVIITRKNGKICICVDLKKVHNHGSLSIAIKHVLERVVGLKTYSFLDGFFGYNQVSNDPKDQHKIAFSTTQGVFAFQKIPFYSTNVLATFYS